MIKPVLKLWSNNSRDWFLQSVDLLASGRIYGVELYANVNEPFDWETLSILKKANVVAIHAPHNTAWHDFWLEEKQREDWVVTQVLANFFSVSNIIVHPARKHNYDVFSKELSRLSDKRILIENMAGCDTSGRPMFGASFSDLEFIQKQAPICFDFEKAIKAASRFGVNYLDFIKECLLSLQPEYGHISGGDPSNSIDEHNNLWDAQVDWLSIKKLIEEHSEGKIFLLAFEVPKIMDLSNDLKNMDFFFKL